MSWLFMFAGHRDLFERAVRAESKIVEQEHAIYDLEQSVRDLKERVIRDLEAQLAQQGNPVPEALLKEFQDSILTELPYPDGKVPEGAWLTPPYRAE